MSDNRSTFEKYTGMELGEFVFGGVILAAVVAMALDDSGRKANSYYRCLDNEALSRTKAGLPPLSDEEVRKRCAEKTGYKPAT